MTNRLNIIAGLLAAAATFVVLPASVALVRDSIKGRQTISVLRVPTTFEIRGSHILDPSMYSGGGATEKSPTLVQLVSFVANPAQADAVLDAWESVKGDPLVTQAGMSLIVSGLGTEVFVGTTPADVAFPYVKDVEEFVVRTGIRVVPFSLIIAHSDSVLAAGVGIPDVAFIRDAADRFIRQGPNAATKFRRMTVELASGLTMIDPVIPGAAIK